MANVAKAISARSYRRGKEAEKHPLSLDLEMVLGSKEAQLTDLFADILFGGAPGVSFNKAEWHYLIGRFYNILKRKRGGK
jgi:hypothetical protein